MSKNEVLMVNIGSLSSGGRVLAVKNDLAKIGLTNPVCTEIGEKIALSRRIEKHWRYVIQLLTAAVYVCVSQIIDCYDQEMSGLLILTSSRVYDTSIGYHSRTLLTLFLSERVKRVVIGKFVIEVICSCFRLIGWGQIRRGVSIPPTE